MNKLIVTDKNYIYNGNNALIPERKSFGEDEKHRLRQEENEKLRNIKKSKLRNQAKVMIGIALTFTIGLSVVYRYSTIYTMEKKLSSVTINNDNMTKSNEDLKLQLMKYNQIQSLEDRASKINMVQPDKNQAVSVDYDRQIIKNSKNVIDDKKGKSIFQKIKDKLF